MSKLFAYVALLAVAIMPAFFAPTASAQVAHTNVVVSVQTIDVDNPPAQVTVHKGEIIAFVRTPKVGTDVMIVPRQMACAQCLSMKPVTIQTPPPGYWVIAAFRADVAGFEDFDVIHKVPGPHTQPRATPVKVLVQ